MTTITAQTILSSQHEHLPHRLTTMLLRYPRCIHAEFMTHRMFSRNAASSRAIPVKKLIEDVEKNPFVPLVWGREQKGMQGGDEIDANVGIPDYSDINNHGEPRIDQYDRKNAWLQARDNAVLVAQAFAKAGYHKQIVNRLLEPFAHITVLVSATEWDNFLELRDHEDAEPHIQMLARAVRAELDKPAMQVLKPGEWHTPFATEADFLEDPEPFHSVIRKSVACCASTSYKTVDGFDMTPERAEAIYEKLVGSTPLHASPLEHQARAAYHHDKWVRNNRFVSPDLHRNFVGFEQYRAIFEEELPT